MVAVLCGIDCAADTQALSMQIQASSQGQLYAVGVGLEMAYDTETMRKGKRFQIQMDGWAGKLLMQI
ncbi:hypothetical protein C6Q18_18640 [Pseudomonas chlororaphis subsp. piscium]|nr:hypothetical protein C6Q18_18640 [Pseudomonas chlororaphis subsp. piscium]